MVTTEIGRFLVTVTLGIQPNADGYRADLRYNRFPIGYGANKILDNPAFTISSEPKTVDLVQVTVVELGLKGDEMLEDIYERALSLGLELCSPEVGPALRKAYPDQAKDERLRLAMEPIEDSSGNPCVFLVDHSDHTPSCFRDSNYERRLDSGWVLSGSYWVSEHPWVFVRPHQS